jgi:hypothetical protein
MPMMSDETPQPDARVRLSDMNPEQLRSLREAYGVQDVTAEELRRCVDPKYVLLRPPALRGGVVGRMPWWKYYPWRLLWRLGIKLNTRPREL